MISTTQHHHTNNPSLKFSTLKSTQVTLRNPAFVKPCQELLEGGLLGMGSSTNMSCFETHIPFLMKFTQDLQVRPMGWLYLEACLFRAPLPDPRYVRISSFISNLNSRDICHDAIK